MSQPGIKVIIRDLRGHLLHTVTFHVTYRLRLIETDCSALRYSLCTCAGSCMCVCFGEGGMGGIGMHKSHWKLVAQIKITMQIVV